MNGPYPVGSGKIGEDMHFQDLLSRGRGSPPDAGRRVPLKGLPVAAGGELPVVPGRPELPVQDDSKKLFHPLAHGVRTRNPHAGRGLPAAEGFEIFPVFADHPAPLRGTGGIDQGPRPRPDGGLQGLFIGPVPADNLLHGGSRLPEGLFRLLEVFPVLFEDDPDRFGRAGGLPHQDEKGAPPLPELHKGAMDLQPLLPVGDNRLLGFPPASGLFEKRAAAAQFLTYLPQFLFVRPLVEGLPLFQLGDDVGEVLPGHRLHLRNVPLIQPFPVQAEVQVSPGPDGDAALPVGELLPCQEFVVHGDGRVGPHLGHENVGDLRHQLRQGESFVPPHGDRSSAGKAVRYGLHPPRSLPCRLEGRSLVQFIHHFVVLPLLPRAHVPLGGGGSHAVEGLGDGERGEEKVDHADGRPGVVLHDHGFNDISSRNPGPEELGCHVGHRFGHVLPFPEAAHVGVELLAQVDGLEGKGVPRGAEDGRVEPVVDPADGYGYSPGLSPGAGKKHVRVHGPETGHRVVVEVVKPVVEGVDRPVGGGVGSLEEAPCHAEGQVEGTGLFGGQVQVAFHPLKLRRRNVEHRHLQCVGKGDHGLVGLRGEVHSLLHVGLEGLLELREQFPPLPVFFRGCSGIADELQPGVYALRHVVPDQGGSPLPQGEDRPVEAGKVPGIPEERFADLQNALQPLPAVQPPVLLHQGHLPCPGRQGRIGEGAFGDGGAPVHVFRQLEDLLVVGEPGLNGVGGHVAEHLQADRRLHVRGHPVGRLVHEPGEVVRGAAPHPEVVLQIGEDEDPLHRICDIPVAHLPVFHHDLLQPPPFEGVHLRPVRGGLGDVHVEGGLPVGGHQGVQCRHVEAEALPDGGRDEIPEGDRILHLGRQGGYVDVPLEPELSVGFTGGRAGIHADEVGEIGMGVPVSPDSLGKGPFDTLPPYVRERPFRFPEGPLPCLEGSGKGVRRGEGPRLPQLLTPEPDELLLEGHHVSHGHAVPAEGPEKLHAVQVAGHHTPEPRLEKTIGLGRLDRRFADGVDLQPPAVLPVGRGGVPRTGEEKNNQKHKDVQKGSFHGNTSEKKVRTGRTGREKTGGPSEERAAAVSVRFHGKIHQEHFPA